jgi:hypothetical protein
MSKNNGVARKATDDDDDDVIGRMRITCWIYWEKNSETHTHS